MSIATRALNDNDHDRDALVHGILGAVAALITAPGSLLVGRYLRSWKHWIYLHIALNVITVALIIACFVMGMKAADDDGVFTGEEADTHRKLGLAILIIAIVQAILGAASRFTRPPQHNYVTLQKNRSIPRYVHIILGIVTVGLLYVQIHEGFEEWDETVEANGLIRNGIKIAFWILVGVEVFLYVVGWPVMEYRGHKLRNADDDAYGYSKSTHPLVDRAPKGTEGDNRVV